MLLALIQAPRAALAEIDLGSWRTHAAMAEQGAVCGAFADLMAMQMLVDEKVGRLLTEDRGLRRFNMIMAMLLVLSLLPMLTE